MTTVRTPAGPVRYEPLAPAQDWLPNGRRAVWMTDEVGCIECCVATILGVARTELPAAPLIGHSKVDELNASAALHEAVLGRGYRMRYAEITRELFGLWWIGVSVDPRPGFDHCVVCRGRSLVFDPALALDVPAGHQIAHVSSLHYAITFDRTEDA